MQDATFKESDSARRAAEELWLKVMSDFDNETFNLPKITSIVSENMNVLDISDLNNYLFVGDSIIRNLGYDQKIPATSILAYPSLGPGSMYNQLSTFDNKDYNISTYTMISNIKPQNIIFNYGICTLEVTRLDFVLEYYNNMLDDIGMYAPNANIFVASILPIQGNSAGTKPNNETINTLNYFLAKMCEDRDIPFLNVAEALKNENGLGNFNYYDESGYHLNSEGEDVYVDYILRYLGE